MPQHKLPVQSVATLSFHRSSERLEVTWPPPFFSQPTSNPSGNPLGSAFRTDANSSHSPPPPRCPPQSELPPFLPGLRQQPPNCPCSLTQPEWSSDSLSAPAPPLHKALQKPPLSQTSYSGLPSPSPLLSRLPLLFLSPSLTLLQPHEPPCGSPCLPGSAPAQGRGSGCSVSLEQLPR